MFEKIINDLMFFMEGVLGWFISTDLNDIFADSE